MKKAVALILAASALFLAGCCTAHKTAQWEYKTLTTLNQDGSSQINSLGKDGWVMVGFTFVPMKQTGANDEYHYVFKRLKQ